MEGNRFDDFIKQLASDASRRSFLKRTVATITVLAGVGGTSATGAARRPSPTPRAVSCPGQQTWNGSACVCPDGATQCGSACCQAGTSCCDGACCPGTCYGEELCCPTGQIVCNGVCLDPGRCCIDSDCGPGYACQGNQCVCVPTTSCASQGIQCGLATDDCGNALSCGECVAPQTCGGGGTSGVCGCTSQITCEGKCGSVTTECGTVLDCGNPCVACQVCDAGNTCVQADFGADCSSGCTSAQCVDGRCIEEYTVPCPPFDVDSCQSYACSPSPQGPLCLGSPTNEGGSCDPETPCQTGKCTNGQCVGTPVVCPVCHECTTSTCQPISNQSCGDGFECVDGGCYAFPGGNDIVSDAMSDGICASLKCEDACCPGETQSTCCNSMDDCFLNGGNGSPYAAFCCAAENKCGSQCCDGGYSCVGNAVCRRDEAICANNPNCNDRCCGTTGAPGSGTCCSSTQQCHDGQCVEVSSNPCNSDDECLGDATCVGLIITEDGHVFRQGSCCLPEYTTGGSGGPVCCSPGTYPTSDPNSPCCSWDTVGCPSCNCSTTSVRGWRR